MMRQVVQEYERAVIFRLGRLLSGGSRGPGGHCDEDDDNVIMRIMMFTMMIMMIMIMRIMMSVIMMMAMSNILIFHL